MKKYKKGIDVAMNDVYPPVSVTAFAIAYDVFQSEDAEDKLKAACKNPNMDIALMAVNYFLYVKDPLPFIDTITKVKSNEKINYNVKAACNDFLGKLNLIKNDAGHEDK